MRLLFGDKQSYKKLDYVSSWFLLASKYIANNESIFAAFVATSSICQGMQVPFLWPRIFGLGVNISFAYSNFAWENAARNKAAVNVVVIGLGNL